MRTTPFVGRLLDRLFAFSPLVRRSRLTEALGELAATGAELELAERENAAFRQGIEAQKRALSKAADDIERLKAKVVTLNAEVARLDAENSRLKEASGYFERIVSDARQALGWV